MSWFKKGVSSDDMAKAKQEAEARGVFRFFINRKKGETSRKVIFLDDEFFTVYEHTLKRNGRFIEYTCRRDADPKDPGCPLCDSGVPRHWIGFLTMIDATGYMKDGKVVLYSRKLFPMRMETLQRFQILKQKKTTLVGAMFECTRASDKASTVGDMFDFVEYVDLKDPKFMFESRLEGKKKSPEPFDYMKILEPKSRAEMMRIVAEKDSVTEGGDGGTEEPEGGEDKDALY